jgi:small-conductance mechanosensitive channel/CRP-like cAMP-binding protein
LAIERRCRGFPRIARGDRDGCPATPKPGAVAEAAPYNRRQCGLARRRGLRAGAAAHALQPEVRNTAPPDPTMPHPDLILNAALFAAVGLLLALITIRLAPGQRKPMWYMTLLMVAGVLGLYALGQWSAALAGTAIVAVARELAILLVAVGFALALLSFLFQGLFARRAVPRILADVLLVLLMVVFVLYRMKAVGVNLASIITTSAVITGVIAFSLQETLGNLWGGIALQLDNTCRLGDWVRVQGVTGKIVSIRWRYLAVATNDGETVIIPNAQLMKNQVMVLARRGDTRIPWRRQVPFCVAYDVAPSRVVAAVEAALTHAEIPHVAREPAPLCTCVEFADSAIRYAVLYWLTDLVHDLVTDSQIRAHVFAALARHDMEIPLPRRVLLTPGALGAKRAMQAQRDLAARAGVLEHLPLFASLTESERRVLAAELTDAPFLAGDIISREGEVSDYMFVLASGSVAVYRGAEADRARRLLTELHAPDYFGEMGLLTGQARSATVIAQNDVRCYRLDRQGFDAILRARPALAQALSETVAQRQAANDATLKALSDEARARQANGRAAELVRRIQTFFGLSR